MLVRRAAVGLRGRARACGGRHQQLVCRALASTPDVDTLQSTFAQLIASAGAETSLRLQRSSDRSLGLWSSGAHEAGDVLLRVPRRTCLVLDYDTGLTIPPARWPRLRGALSPSVEPLPWDVILALGLLDALAGDGDPFWAAYAEALLPPPESLTLPMCWEAARLAQLQHADIAAGATAQQDRLSGMLPELMEPLGPDVPSWLQWAFACVRSRAFRAGPDAFAFVPFLDLANHADAPPAQPGGASPSPSPSPPPGPAPPAAPSSSPASQPPATADFRASADGQAFELYAVRQLGPGTEVTIAYGGEEGYTNQRYMAQYGFVPRGGNPADRVKLEAPEGLPPLSLARLQDVVGDAAFVAAATGKDPYLAAALRSLPLADEEGEAAAEGSGRTAAALLRQVEAYIAEGTSSLEADEQLLAAAEAAAAAEADRSSPSAAGQGATGGAGSAAAAAAAAAADPRDRAALAYRVERKRLLGRAAALLRAYVRAGAGAS